MKVILNKCYGGFSVSPKVYELYAKSIGKKAYFYNMQYSDGIVKYIKTDEPTFFSSCFLRDYGDIVQENEINWTKENLHVDGSYREDKKLIEIVKKLGDKANSPYSNLKIVEIPDGMQYVIDDYDGIETLHEDVETW